jgi:hypothetical protein
MITDSNQAYLAKMIGRRVQEEVIAKSEVFCDVEP